MDVVGGGEGQRPSQQQSLLLHVPLRALHLSQHPCMSALWQAQPPPPPGKQQARALFMATDFSRQVAAWWEGSQSP